MSTAAMAVGTQGAGPGPVTKQPENQTPAILGGTQIPH